MAEVYTRQLRTDSNYKIIPATFLIMVGGTLAIYLDHHAYSGISHGAIILNIVASFLIAHLAWQLADKDRQELAGTVLVTGHVLLLALNYAGFWTPSSPIPYLYTFFVVISSIVIKPQASITTWLATTAFMFVATIFLGEGGWSTFSPLLLPAFLGLILAVVGWASAAEWQMALESVGELHYKVQRRRDELFQVQEELQHTNGRLQFLYQQLETSTAVGQRITAILNVDILLTQVVDLIRTQFGFNYVGIFLLDEDNAQLEIRTQSGWTAENLGDRPPLPVALDGPISTAALNLSPVCVSDVTLEDQAHPYLLHNSRSELALPLMRGDQLLGVLDIQSSRVAHFDEDNLPMLRSLAGQVTVAIQNATLYEREETRRRLTETMRDIGRAISGTLDLEKVLNLVLDHLITIVSYDRASVLLHRGNDLEIVAARGFPADSQPLKLRIPIADEEDDVFLQIYHTQRPLAIADVLNYTGWRQVETLPKTRAWLGIPLLHDNQVIGMLSLSRETPKPYSEEEVTLANTFAAQAAVALQNARLYNKIARFNQQLEYEVQKRTEALQEAYDQLERLDRTKSDFIGIASHELRTPLTVLRGYSDILINEAAIQENDYYRQLVTGISTGANRLHDIVNDMLDMAKIDSRDLNLYRESVHIRILVDSVYESMEKAVADRNLTLAMENLEELPAIEADPDVLRKVFYHLVINAIKYTPDGGLIAISGQYLPDGEEAFPQESIKITVRDTGIGIDAAVQELIFAKFYQTGKVALHSTGKTKFKGGGPGLGLTIARGIVEAHHGKIWVESPGHDEETCPGSQFHILLPVCQ